MSAMQMPEASYCFYYLSFHATPGLPRPAPSTADELNAAVTILAKMAQDWAAMPLSSKAQVFRKCLEAAIAATPEINDLETKAKGLYD